MGCVYPCVGGGQKPSLGVQILSILVVEEDLSRAWSLPGRIAWLVSELQGSTCLCLLTTRIMSVHICFYLCTYL